MVGAVDGVFNLYEPLLYFREQGVHRVEKTARVFFRVLIPRGKLGDFSLWVYFRQFGWNVSGESRQHGAHVEFALTLGDAFLQFELPIKPRLGQGAEPSVNVYHPVPWQVGRAGEVGAYGLVVETHLVPHLIPDALLARDGEWQVDAVEGHPVDEVLPFVPFPPGHGVAVSAIVEKEAVFHPRLDGDGLGHARWGSGQLVSVGLEPSHVNLAIVFHVVVQRRGHGVGVVAADYYFPAFRLKAEDIGLAVYLLKREGVLIAWEHSMHKAPDGGDVVAVGAENVHDTE